MRHVSSFAHALKDAPASVFPPLRSKHSLQLQNLLAPACRVFKPIRRYEVLENAISLIRFVVCENNNTVNRATFRHVCFDVWFSRESVFNLLPAERKALRALKRDFELNLKRPTKEQQP